MTNISFLPAPAHRLSALAVVLGLMALPALTSAQTLRLPGAPRAPGLGASQPASPAGTTASGAAQRQADFIVAVVNSEPITNTEVQLRVDRAAQQLTRQGTTPPRSELAREVLERLILERIQLQTARSTGLRPDETAVDVAVASVARQNQISMEALRARLRADGVSYEQFRQDIRNELTLLRLRDRELESRVKVTDQEVDQFLREQTQQAGAAPEAINFAQILVAVPENASAAQVAALQAKAQQAYERARAGGDFAALATELSDGPEKAAGGQFGLRPADRLPPLFLEATRTLPAGSVAAPVRSGAGFHVLKVIEKKQAGPAGLSVPQTRARHILLRPGAQLSEQAAIARLVDYKRRVAAGQADFAALAREHSQDGSAAQGGDLGWAPPGMFVPEFEQAMEPLGPGQMADPVVSRFGVHLIQVLERREVAASPREQREMARAQLRESRMEQAYAQWLQDLRGRAYVEYREPPQ